MSNILVKKTKVLYSTILALSLRPAGIQQNNLCHKCVQWMKNDKQTVLFYFLLKHHKHGWLKQVRVQFSNSIIVVEPHHFWKVESKTSWLDWSNCICEVCVKVAPTRVHKRFSLSFFFFFQIRCQVCRCLNISHVTRVWHEQRRCHFSVTFPHFFRKCSSEQRPVVTW